MASLAGAGLLVCANAASASPRFFASSAQCESAHVLAAGGCRTAFANALAEFASKAPSFPSRRACFRAFGPCMPWPPGTRRFSEFRPQWIGVTVEDGDVATPAVAPGRRPLAFTPQSTASLSSAATTSARSKPPADEVPDARIMTPHGDDDGEAGGPAPRAGGGFTMIDGVLTYPAPARFQPRAARHP